MDSRIIGVQYAASGSDEWIFGGVFRGQSHDIKSLIHLNEKTLLSGGETTDVCVYDLSENFIPVQFGKKHQVIAKSKKLRHIAPFPFQKIAK